MAGDCSALRAVMRLKAGLSPLERLEDLTVDLDRHHKFVSSLIGSFTDGGSGLGVVVGPYGSGKTHFLQLAKRQALVQQLGVAQLSQDTGLGCLGHPQRHIFQIITSLTFPVPYGLAMEWLARSLADPVDLKAVKASFRELQRDCPTVASTALWILDNAPEPMRAPVVLDYLSGALLVGKTAHPTTRARAYELIRFWAVLATRILGVRGIFLLVDELESLFSNAIYWSIMSRRAAYRTLSYYTEVLQPALTLCALTPTGWKLLAAEIHQSNGFFSDAPQLDAEDIASFFRRVTRTQPYELAPLNANGYRSLLERIVVLHSEARGYPRELSDGIGPPRFASSLTPRIFAKSVVSALERLWFQRVHERPVTSAN